MDLAKKKFGLLVSTPPEHDNLETALGLSRAALDRGADVYLYLIDDAVTAAEDRRVQALADRGLKLFVCAYGCQKRRLPLSEKATNCGLVVLTDIINGTDRFLALN
ncbi:MAG TPA: DsrE family protein [Methylomirabilota bacterium]|nr:DsrE family protein [Methylomirabilota bacterium]